MVPRELIEQGLIILIDERAVEPTVPRKRLDIVIQQPRHRRHERNRQIGEIRQADLHELGVEARGVGRVVRVEQVGEVVHPAGEVREVDAGVGVDAVGVAAEPEGVRVRGVLDGEVREDVGGVVLRCVRRGRVMRGVRSLEEVGGGEDSPGWCWFCGTSYRGCAPGRAATRSSGSRP